MSRDTRQILEELLAGHILCRKDSHELLMKIAGDQVNPSELAALFAVYRFRVPSIDEMEGFRDAMLDSCRPLDLGQYDPIDLCGTGGDGKNTFNVSTASAFVVAASGIKVAKHGNYSFSSTSGSSNVLEVLGIRLTEDQDFLERSIETAGVCFVHAPLFHTAFKGVQPIRKALGIRTFFNLLGPLVNPVQPRLQVVGVSNPELSRIYRNVLQRAGKEFRIVHSFDGYDELSLTGLMRITSSRDVRDVAAKDFGLVEAIAAELSAPSDLSACARLLEDVLNGRGTSSQQSVVVANSAVAIQMLQPERSLGECVGVAKDAIASGRAGECLNKVREMSSR